MTPGAILVIDGRAESRAALVRAVVETDYSSLEAGTAAEGLALLGSLHPLIVLLDIDHLENGLDLARQIKLENADVPVLILSSSEDTDLVVKGMRTGAYDFLVKPVGAATLKNVFKAALTQSDGPAVLTPQGGNGGTMGQPALNLDLLFRNSERMRVVEDIVRRAADTNATILLQGESGTGKEMVARAIHNISDRRDKPFLKVNCASLPGDLLESELFGHEKGSFTGAHRRKPGKFGLHRMRRSARAGQRRRRLRARGLPDTLRLHGPRLDELADRPPRQPGVDLQQPGPRQRRQHGIQSGGHREGARLFQLLRGSRRREVEHLRVLHPVAGPSVPG